MTCRDGAPPPRTIRVCLVGPSLDILGGQAVQAARLLERLRTIPGLEVEFLPVNPRLPGPLRVLQRVRYVRTVATSVAYAWSLLRHVPRFDVVHAFSASYFSYLLAPLPAMAVARLYGKRTVLNYRSGEAEDHLARWRTAVPTIGRFADAVVVPSGYLVEVFGRFGLAARAVFNFVDPDAIPYRRRPAPRPVFLSNRNLEPLYNVGCTLRAFALVQRELPDASLLVVGDGAERPTLERLAAELGLRHVEFAGRVPPARMGACYDACDVYLNSPNIDNMPGSIIEAYAAGLPVVTTDAGGIPYIVEHERTGLMVPRDAPGRLAAAALRVVREPGLAARLTDAARAECQERYVWPAVREEWARVYAELAPAEAAP
ncbi:MAG TPA: glycosyltransferase family 4 protein [Gemmatimonadaceae bacterium]|nr:glycosyltransferase family 4 protein [Gemmatimonadaceae bacterium]